MTRRLPYRLVVLCAAIVALSAEIFAQQRLIVDTLAASSVGAPRPLVILLPNEYKATTRYPVLYLLHGYSGGCRDWIDRTGLKDYVSGWPLIVVMPDAGNSWYVDSQTDSSARFEHYIVWDVRSYVESRYPVDSTRRAIAGLSMGGYGALMLAMRHPDLYHFAGSLSGAIVVPASLRKPDDAPSRPAIRATQIAAFGKPTDAVLDRYDLHRLLKRLTPEAAPYFYLVTGIQDGLVEFLPAQRLLTDDMRSRHIPYEYHETPGGHSWSFWNREIRPLLVRMREVLKY